MHLSFIAAKAIELKITIINLFCRVEDIELHRKLYPNEGELEQYLSTKSFFRNLLDTSPTNKNSYHNQLKSLSSHVGLSFNVNEDVRCEDLNLVCIFDFERSEIRAAITYRVEENHLNISKLVVHPKYRRRGFGTLLLLCAINHASLLRKQYVKLINNSHYSPVWKASSGVIGRLPEQTFYQKLGFRPDYPGDPYLKLNLADPIVNTLFLQKGLVRRNSFSSFESLKHQKYEEKRVLHFFKKDPPFLPIF